MYNHTYTRITLVTFPEVLRDYNNHTTNNIKTNNLCT